jgi:hypothetical protein
MPTAICIALSPDHTPPRELDPQSCFNFRSEAEGLISAVLSCVDREVQVDACMAATPGYRNAARTSSLHWRVTL